MPERPTLPAGRRTGPGSPAGIGHLLSEIELALARPSPGGFIPELEQQYELRTGAARRERLARALRIAAVLVLAAFGLDLFNGASHIVAFAVSRVCVGGLCLVAAGLQSRLVRPLHEQLAYGASCLCIIVATASLAQIASPHYADRYVMAAAIGAILLLGTAPAGIGTSRVVAALSGLLFLLVPAVFSGALPLRANWDLLLFGWGTLGVATLIARLNARQARTAFLHMLRHDLAATELTLLNAELLRLSNTDALTGLPNRRAFDAEGQRLWRDRNVAGLGLALIDVDRFKIFNDTAGHDAGDACLRRVASLVSAAVRGRERPARYGGEEFVLLCPCERGDLVALGERLRHAVESDGMAHPGLGGAAVTISVGLAWLDAPQRSAASLSDLLRSADAALYEAKESGRNRVAIAGAHVACG